MKLLKLKIIGKSNLYVIIEVTYKSFFGAIKNRKVNFPLEYPKFSIWMDNGEYIKDSLKENIKAFLLMDLEEFVV